MNNQDFGQPAGMPYQQPTGAPTATMPATGEVVLTVVDVDSARSVQIAAEPGATISDVVQDALRAMGDNRSLDFEKTKIHCKNTGKPLSYKSTVEQEELPNGSVVQFKPTFISG